jgi:hypothetical protein
MSRKAIAIGAIVALWLGSLSLTGLTNRPETRGLRPIAGVVTLAAIGVSIAAYRGSRRSCPACGDWWAAVQGRSKVTGQTQAIKTVNRTDKTTGYGVGAGGILAGSAKTQRKEQVRVLRTKLTHHFSCNVCLHQWSTSTNEDAEDFEVDG